MNIGGHVIPVKRTFWFKWTTPIKRPFQQQKKGDIHPQRVSDWWKGGSLMKKRTCDCEIKDGVRGCNLPYRRRGGIELGEKEIFMNPRGFQYSLEWGGRQSPRYRCRAKNETTCRARYCGPTLLLLMRFAFGPVGVVEQCSE